MKGAIKMFKLYIGLDEERMERDGLDVDAAWEQINDMIEETGDIDTISKGVYDTESSGARSYLMMLMRDEAWFMKYVNKWIIDDPSRRENAIAVYRDMGMRCSYDE